MKAFSIILLVFICLAGYGLPAQAATGALPLAKQGVIDLRGVDWEQKFAVPLNGEWSFYWGKLLTPSTLENERVPHSYIKVPSTWGQAASASFPISDHGYATYRLVLQLGEEEINRPLALYMPSIASAYQLWINGELREANGVVGTNRGEMTPKNYAKVVAFQTDHREVEVLIHVSNFVQRKGGLWEEVRIGYAASVLLEREKAVVFESMMVACLFIMGFYHLALFLTRKKENSALFFGGMCLAIGTRTLFLGETIAVRFFPHFDWFIGVRLEYLSSLATMMFLLMFVHSQYPQETNRKIRNGCLWGGCLFFLFVLFSPTWIFTEGLIVKEVYLLISYGYVLYVYVLAAIRKRPGWVLNGIGLVAFFLCVVNEILFYAHLSSFENAVPLGLLTFLFSQMLILSIVFARSFDHVEQLSEELVRTNESLEGKVQARTQALEQKNEELHKLENSRRKLLSNIAHELGTPLTSIQGFIKAMIDGVVKPEDPKYLNIIYQKTVYLHRIITDLFELSKMEAGQIRFHYQPIAAVPFFRQIHEKYLLDMQKKDLRFEWVAGAPPIGRVPVIMADPIRIEQVVVNLLVNAQAYTAPGGTIALQVEWEIGLEGTGEFHVRVRDTGTGIEAGSLPFVFDRFYKGSESRKRRSEGVGLGLAISKEIILNHQGQISVESTPGEGSTFLFSLPARWEDK